MTHLINQTPIPDDGEPNRIEEGKIVKKYQNKIRLVVKNKPQMYEP